MSEKTQGARNIAEEAFGNERKFKQLVGALSGPSRRERQNAAAALSFFAKDHPDLMIPFGAAVIDALNRPEAQTRWECLDILTTMSTTIPARATKRFPEPKPRCSTRRAAGAFGSHAVPLQAGRYDGEPF